MTLMRRNLRCALIGALMLAVASPLRAHHSYAMFDFNKRMEVAGTVHNLEWTNPHVWLWVTVTDGRGNTALYAFEGTSSGEMSRRSGWTKSTVSFGDKVKVQFSPFKDGKNGGRIEAVTLADGRTLGADRGIHLPPPSGHSPN